MFRKILINNSSVQFTARNFGKHNKKFIYKDGQRYEGVTYYPRDPNHVDPEIEPAKCFRVERIKPIKGAPYWEKRILEDLGIDQKLHDVTVVKNIPENNARLWKVKHLIKVTPIRFPHGEPTAEDINYTVLKENGDCLVMKKLGVTEDQFQATKKYEEDTTRLDGDTLKKDTRLKWLNNW